MKIKAYRIKEEDEVVIIGMKEPWWYRVKTSKGLLTLEHSSNLQAKGYILGKKPRRVE